MSQGDRTVQTARIWQTVLFREADAVPEGPSTERVKSEETAEAKDEDEEKAKR